MIRFSSVILDQNGRPRTGVHGITFALYREQEGGSPLWMETVNADVDAQGRYTVLLGGTNPEGMPVELFSSGEARWLGVQGQLPGDEEQRVILVAVPYALKAADAETLGGKPISAFVLAESGSAADTGAAATSPASGVANNGRAPDGNRLFVQNANYIAKFNSSTPGDLTNSVLYEMSGFIGIGTTNPQNILQLESPGPSLVFRENDTAYPYGLWRWRADGGGSIFFEKNTAVAGNFSTSVVPLRMWPDAGDQVINIVGNNIGIGTVTPTQKLEVAGTVKVTGTGNGIIFPDGSILTSACGTLASGSPSGDGVVRNASTTSEAASASACRRGVFSVNDTGDLLTGQVAGGKVFRVDHTGKGFFNGGTQTGGADFAESLETLGETEDYEPGDVLVISMQKGRSVDKTGEPYSTRVAGVYSTKPGVLATTHAREDPRLAGEIPVAVVGIVPCKVIAENGPISIGDLLVTSSKPGHAMKGTERTRMLGAIVGKALEPHSAGTGVIQVLITLQ